MKSILNLILACFVLLPVAGLQAQISVTQVAAGGFEYANGIGHSLFVKSDGSLWAMGNNSDGQLGDGTNINMNRPEPILAGGVTAIAAGGAHSLFIRNPTFGTTDLYAMGNNDYGQLGNTTTNSSSLPKRIEHHTTITGNPFVTAISAGGYHSLFIKSDGSLWAMGRNNRGQLGDGSGVDRSTPVEIETTGVTAIAAGGTHSLFLMSDGSLWAMGENTDGQLGDGTTNNGNFASYLPERIEPGGVTAIAAGSRHSLFLMSDGSLWGMGDNSYGEVGIVGIRTNSPVQIMSSGVTAIAAGGVHNLLIANLELNLQFVVCLEGMGDNFFGELGTGGYGHLLNPTPILIDNYIPFTNVTSFAAGGTFSLFVNDGALWAMGADFSGQLGDNAFNLGVNLPELVGTDSPTLGISTLGSQPVLFYSPSTGSNYSVQMTTNLASSNWVTVTNLVPIIAYQVTNPPPNAFYRLH